jgi:hypothetical protein
MQYPQVPGDARLVDPDQGNEVVDGVLVTQQQFHDVPSGGVRQRLEHVNWHTDTYTLWCI